MLLGARERLTFLGRTSTEIEEGLLLFSNGLPLLAGAVVLLLLSCFGLFAADDGVPRLDVIILNEFPHDSNAFTQGFFFCGDSIFESIGGYGRSRLRKVVLRTGEVLREHSLPSHFFGEGLARIGNRLIQLTWRENVAFLYDLPSFREVGQFSYQGEGWGLTYDGEHLIMSEGTHRLLFREPLDFSVARTVEVTLEGSPVPLLNELEYVEGYVYANVWKTEQIMKIDPATGVVVAVIDASILPYEPRRFGEDVLNGIAYDPDTNTFLLTGKLWPRIYQVRFREVTAQDGS